MKSLRVYSKTAVVLLLLLVAIAVSGFLFSPTLRKQCCAAEYRTFMAPDGSYRIVVYRISVFPMMMPGSAGDAPGFVRLYDRSDRILQEMDVEMVQLVDEVAWSDAAVHVKFLADWTLPRGDR